MKRLLVGASFLLVVSLFGAEVSEKKEIAVMPVYSSYNLPSSAYMYFDDQMIGTISSMKRFQVIGYQYRLDNTTAERFIERIRELKKQAILKNPQYKDEDLGIAVIPAAELERLVKSVFIFVPSINGYSSKNYNVEVKYRKQDGSYDIRIEREYWAQVNISVKIIDTEGNLLATYNESAEAKSRKSDNDAYQMAVNSAIGGLGFYLRSLDEFKLKTRVLKVEGDYVYLELGGNLGIQPGYEFAIEEQVPVLGQFVERRRVGLVRVSYVSDQYSYGHVIFGRPKVEDQLIEAPKAGSRLGLVVGAMPLKVPASTILTYNEDISFSKPLSFSSVGGYSVLLGMNFDLELGYSWLWESFFALGISDPFMLFLSLGPAYEWYMRNTSIVFGARLGVAIGTKPVGRIDNPGSLSIGGKTFYENVDVSLNWFDFALQPYLSYNIQFNQTVKMRIYGGFNWSFYQMVSLYFAENSSDENRTTVSVTPKFDNWDGKLGTTGVIGGIEVIFRL